MESGNHSPAGSEFEHVIDEETNIVEVPPPGSEELQAKNGALKAKNKLLLGKVDALQAHIGELQAKLEVAELKAKLANVEVPKLVEAKMTELADKLEENQRKFVENEQKNKQTMEQLTKEVKVLEKKVYSIGIVAPLEESQKQHRNQEADNGQNTAANKCIVESCKEMVEATPPMLIEQQKFPTTTKFQFPSSPQNNCWGKWNGDSVTVNGLFVTKTGTVINCGNVMAKFAYANNLYFEVLVKKYKDFICIGVSGADYTEASLAGGNRNSCSISTGGIFYNAGTSQHGYGFSANDTVGFGVMALPGTELRVFFVTKNGKLNGAPVIIASVISKQLYPAVSLSGVGNFAGSSIEANFGADLANKPFKYNIAEHKF